MEVVKFVTSAILRWRTGPACAASPTRWSQCPTRTSRFIATLKCNSWTHLTGSNNIEELSTSFSSQVGPIHWNLHSCPTLPVAFKSFLGTKSKRRTRHARSSQDGFSRSPEGERGEGGLRLGGWGEEEEGGAFPWWKGPVEERIFEKNFNGSGELWKAASKKWLRKTCSHGGFRGSQGFQGNKNKNRNTRTKEQEHSGFFVAPQIRREER